MDSTQVTETEIRMKGKPVKPAGPHIQVINEGSSSNNLEPTSSATHAQNPPDLFHLFVPLYSKGGHNTKNKQDVDTGKDL